MSVTVCPYCGDVMPYENMKPHLTQCKGQSPPKDGLEYYAPLNSQQRSSTRERTTSEGRYHGDERWSASPSVPAEPHSPPPRNPGTLFSSGSDNRPYTSLTTPTPSLRTSSSFVPLKTVDATSNKFSRSDAPWEFPPPLRTTASRSSGSPTATQHPITHSDRVGTSTEQSSERKKSSPYKTESLASLQRDSLPPPRSKLSRVIQGRLGSSQAKEDPRPSASSPSSTAPTPQYLVKQLGEVEEMNYLLLGKLNEQQAEIRQLRQTVESIRSTTPAVEDVELQRKYMGLESFKMATNSSIDHLERRCDMLERELQEWKAGTQRPVFTGNSPSPSTGIKIIPKVKAEAAPPHSPTSRPQGPPRSFLSYVDPNVSFTDQPSLKPPPPFHSVPSGGSSVLHHSGLHHRHEWSPNAQSIFERLSGPPNVCAESPWKPAYTYFV